MSLGRLCILANPLVFPALDLLSEIPENRNDDEGVCLEAHTTAFHAFARVVNVYAAVQDAVGRLLNV